MSTIGPGDRRLAWAWLRVAWRGIGIGSVTGIGNGIGIGIGIGRWWRRTAVAYGGQAGLRENGKGNGNGKLARLAGDGEVSYKFSES